MIALLIVFIITTFCMQALRRESPKLGGSFANWGLTFSLFDCSLQYLRKKVRDATCCDVRTTHMPLHARPCDPCAAGGPVEPHRRRCSHGRLPAAPIGVQVCGKVRSVWRNPSGRTFIHGVMLRSIFDAI